MSKLKLLIRSVAAVVAIATFVGCDSSTPDTPFYGTEISPARAAPGFSGPNWDGTSFTLAGQRGKVVLLAFGYTFCPDVCPFTLRRLAKVHEQLGDRAAQIAVVFVSVDPERDTIDKLKTYIPSFHRDFFGLRPEGEDMAALLKDYHIKVTKQPPATGGGYYAVDHTGDVFLIDKTGQLRLTHPHNTTVDALLTDVQSLLEEETQ